MVPAEGCLICGGRDLHLLPALVSPFLRHRCRLPLAGPPLGRAPLHRAWCPRCDFAFFDQRLDEEETSRLYTGYRTEPYDRERVALEPDYAGLIPQFQDRGNYYHRARIAGTGALFRAWGIPFQSVLDFGGEPDGWLARTAFPGRDVSVFDMSADSEPPQQEGYDLVFCAHVLEHVSFPLAFVKELRQFVKPGGHLYAEVPLEYPESGLVSTWSADSAFNGMHEHVSAYGPRALIRLMLRAGLEPLDLRPVVTTLGLSLGILAHAGTAPELPLEADLHFPPWPPEPHWGRLSGLLYHARLPEAEHVALGTVWTHQAGGDHEEALRCLDAWPSGHPVVLAEKGRSLAALKRDGEAQACYLSAMEADPSYPLAFLHLARLLAQHGRVADARNVLEAGLDQVPVHEVLWRELVGLSARHDPDGAAGDAWDALRSVPSGGDTVWHQMVIHALLQQGANADARIVLDLALRAFPGHPELLALRERVAQKGTA